MQADPLRGMMLTALVCIGGLSAPSRLSAQGLSLGNVSEDRPIEISADSGIEWQQDAQMTISLVQSVE